MAKKKETQLHNRYYRSAYLLTLFALVCGMLWNSGSCYNSVFYDCACLMCFDCPCDCGSISFFIECTVIKASTFTLIVGAFAFTWAILKSKFEK